jgi:hypothetical protein
MQRTPSQNLGLHKIGRATRCSVVLYSIVTPARYEVDRVARVCVGARLNRGALRHSKGAPRAADTA